MALRIDDLTATTTFVGTDEFELSLAGAAGSRKITGSNLRKQIFAGGTGFTSTDPINAGIGTFAGGIVTTSSPVITATQTWNDGAVTFTGWKLNVTNTASAAASKLIDLQVGGVSQFSVTRAGAGAFLLSSSVTAAADLTGVSIAATTTNRPTVLFTNATTGDLAQIRALNTKDLELYTNGNSPVRALKLTAAGGAQVGIGLAVEGATVPSAGIAFGGSTPGVLVNGQIWYDATNFHLAGGAILAGAVSGVTTLTATGQIKTTVTTQQLSLNYDASNHLAITVGSTGTTTYNATGSGASHAFSDPVDINGALSVIPAAGLILVTSSSPASNGTGTAGSITWDANYIYVCTATNTWERAALTGGY